MPFPVSLIPSLIAPPVAPAQYRPSNIGLADTIASILDRSQRQKLANEQMSLSRDQLSQQRALEEAKQRASMDAEGMKEKGRMSRAQLRQSGNEARLNLDRERLALDSSKRDDPLFAELRQAEAQGDKARVQATLAEMERRGYTVGRDGQPQAPDAAPTASASFPDAPPDSPQAPAAPGVPTARFDDAPEDSPSPGAAPAPDSGPPIGTGRKYLPGEAFAEAEGKIAEATGGISGLKAGAKKPAQPADPVKQKIDAQFAELGQMLNAGGIKPPPTKKPMPGDAMDAAGKQIQETTRGIPNPVPELPGGTGFTITGKGGSYKSSAKGTSDFNKQRIQETFAGLEPKDANEQLAVERGMGVAMGAAGSMPLEEAIKKGIESYKFEINRHYRRKPWQGGGKAGMSRQDRLALGGVADDLMAFYREQKSSNDYKGVVQAEGAAQQSLDLLDSERPTADAAALGALVKSTEGGRPTDADREVYLRSQGAMQRLKQRFNEATATGEEVVMTPEFRADLKAISELNKSIARNRRKRLADNFKKSARGLASIRERYPDKKLFEEDVNTLGDSILQDESGGPDESATGPSAAPKPVKQMTDDERKARMNQLMKENGM